MLRRLRSAARDGALERSLENGTAEIVKKGT
jgi:hypothetical protein